MKVEAIHALNRALEISPAYVLAYFNLGNIYFDLGRKQEAIELYEKALEINPQYADVYFNKALAYEQGFDFKKDLLKGNWEDWEL